MAADAAVRERRLWMTLGASAVVQLLTLSLVVALMAGRGQSPLPAVAEEAALGRRSGRSLLQAEAVLASSIKVGAKGDLVFTLPVTFNNTVDVNAMFYAQWLKVDTLARIEKLLVEDSIKTNTLEVVSEAKVGGKVTVEDLEATNTAAVGTIYSGNPKMAGTVLNVYGLGLFGAGSQAEETYYTEVAPGKVTTHSGKNGDCGVGVTWADVMQGTKPSNRVCSL